MNGPRRIAPVVAVTGTSLVVGCSQPGYYYGGSCGSYGSYGSYAACPVPYIYRPGMYAGSLREGAASQGQPVIGIIAGNGDARMSGVNDTYYRLKVNSAGKALSGAFTGYSQSGSLPNGTRTITGAIRGIASRADLDATLTGPGNTQQALAMTLENHNAASSLTTLVGNWTSTSTSTSTSTATATSTSTPTSNGLTLTATIQPDGSFMAVDSDNCTYTGAFSLLDPKFNAYAETHVRTCGGVAATFTGLAAFSPGSGAGVTGTPAQITLLTDDAAGEYLVAALQ